jgi:hypothetical protein
MLIQLGSLKDVLILRIFWTSISEYRKQNVG